MPVKLHCIFMIFLTVFLSKLNVTGQTGKIIDSLNTSAFQLRFSEPALAHDFSEKAIRLAGTDTLNSAFILSLRNAGMSKFAMSETDQSLAYLHRALSVSGRISDSIALSACHNNLYIIYKASGNIGKAKKHIISSVEIDLALGDTAGYASGLNYLAEFYYNDGKNKEALELYNQAATLAQTAGDMTGAADALNNIAAVYYQIGAYDLCIIYYKKALDIYTEQEYATGIAMTMSNIGLALSEMGQGLPALKYLNRSIEIYSEINDQRGLAHSYLTKATIYQSLDSLEKAEEVFYQAIHLAMDVGNYILLAKAFSSHAKFYLTKEDTIQAIQSFQNCLEFARDVEFGTLIHNALLNLSELYAATGNFEKAFSYQKELLQLENRETTYPIEIGEKPFLAQEIPDQKQTYTQLRVIVYICLSIILVLSVINISLYRKVKKPESQNMVSG